MHLLYFTSYLFLSQTARAAPSTLSPGIVLSNSSITVPPDYVGYVGDPNGRGTASLVISCLLTLILCVWSALHLNVPRQDETMLQCFFIKLRWIITGVYAPELVVFTAWRQWCSAKILRDLIEDLQQRQTKGSDSELPNNNNKWSMAHSFFACTGGFAFDTENDETLASTPFLPPDCPRRLTITASGMAFLAKCGHVPRVSKAEITDKSKANDIAKALVLIQASWMLVQVIGRVIAGLPVTLLEVNIIAHV